MLRYYDEHNNNNDLLIEITKYFLKIQV